MEWILERMKSGELPIYTGDFETDPFARGKVPVPFVVGFYDGLDFRSFKTDKQGSCEQKLVHFLEDSGIEPGIIYFHNGGRFDFFYLLECFEGKTTVINSRIVRALMPILPAKNQHRFERGECFEFRDSFAIMPFPLATYQKDKLEVDKLSRARRQEHWDDIISYLRGDCVYLWELCVGFQREFGDYKTIASAAFAQLCKFHKYDTLTQRTDAELRGRYYFGGRVQCFEKGIVTKPLTIYDVNSMYPFVMESYLHPTSWPVTVDNRVVGWHDDGTPNRNPCKTFFLTVEGQNLGAFPTRENDGSVDFTRERGIFHVTIHEWLEALKLERFKPERILDAYSFTEYSRFHLFVDHYYQARRKVTAEFNEHKKACDLCGHKQAISATEGNAGYCAVGGDLVAHNLYYKYVLNSAYGKFGLNPENYFNWQITKSSEAPKGEGWTLENLAHAKFYVWKQPTQIGWNVKNIGTAASITGAARSILLRAIALSRGVVYCDTDSIICGEFNHEDQPGLAQDEKKLGCWKPEGSGRLAAIAGKKTYAIFDENAVCIKHACKGVQLTPEQIYRVANGEEILTFRDAPTFKIDGSATFIKRTARLT
jgi:DNA polymerase type B, organellar and viral